MTATCIHRGCGTYSPCMFIHSCCWPLISQTVRPRKAAPQTPQRVHSQILLLLSPCTTPAFSSTLHDNICGLSTHLKYSQRFIVWLSWDCYLIIYLFCFRRFWGSIWWRWHPVTDFRVDGLYSHRSTSFFSGAKQTDHFPSNYIQFTVVDVLVSGFFKNILKQSSPAPDVVKFLGSQGFFMFGMLKWWACLALMSSTASKLDCRFQCAGEHLFGA